MKLALALVSLLLSTTLARSAAPVAATEMKLTPILGKAGDLFFRTTLTI